MIVKRNELIVHNQRSTKSITAYLILILETILDTCSVFGLPSTQLPTSRAYLYTISCFEISILVMEARTVGDDAVNESKHGGRIVANECIKREK